MPAEKTTRVPVGFNPLGVCGRPVASATEPHGHSGTVPSNDFHLIFPLSNMTNVNKSGKSAHGSNALQDALILMGEQLTAWRRSLESPGPGEAESHQDKFVIAAQLGYRLMALKRGHTVDAANDIAQTCIWVLLKRMQSNNRPPFLPSLIDALLAGGSKPAKKPASSSTPLAGYLYGMLSKGVGAQARLIRMRESRSSAADLGTGDNDPSTEESGGDGFMGTSPDKVLLNVSTYQNHALALQIQNDYLNTVTYKGKHLCDVFGEWTPMGEWTGRYSKKERPDGITKEMLLFHIRSIRELILSAKKMTTPLR